MSDDLQSWFKDLPYKLQRELAGDLRDIADGLADDIRTAAPEGITGKLKQSIRVRRGRNALELFVLGGGPLTTVEVRSGSGVSSDYSLHLEFGTSKMPAQPFFYSTYRERSDDVREQIEEAVNNVLAKA